MTTTTGRGPPLPPVGDRGSIAQDAEVEVYTGLLSALVDFGIREDRRRAATPAT